MSISKTFIASLFTISAFGIATTAQAQSDTVCLDGSVATGDCIEVLPPEPNTPASRGNDQEDDD
jgi:hypothetical protein